jgi:hypothetical protein
MRGGGAQYARILDPVFAKSSPQRLFSVTVNERFGLVFAKTGSISLACSCAHRAQLNFDDLTPYILPQKTDNKHKSAWVQAVGGSTQQNHNTNKAVA